MKRLSDSNKIVIHFITFVVIFYISTNMLEYIGVAKEIGDAISAGLGIFYLEIFETFRRNKQTPKERVEEITKGKYYAHPIMGILYTFGFLQLSSGVFGFITSVSAGYVLGYFEGYFKAVEPTLATIISTIAEENQVVLLATLTATAIAEWVLIFPVTVFVSHRVKSKAIIWVSLGILSNAAVSIPFGLLTINSVRETFQGSNNGWGLLGALLGILLFSPGILLGYWYARKTQPQFTMIKVFQQLPSETQTSLIEIIVDEYNKSQPTEDFKPTHSELLIDKSSSTIKNHTKTQQSMAFFTVNILCNLAVWAGLVSIGNIQFEPLIFWGFTISIGIVASLAAYFSPSKYLGTFFISSALILVLLIFEKQTDFGIYIFAFIFTGMLSVIVLYITNRIIRIFKIEPPTFDWKHFSWAKIFSAINEKKGKLLKSLDRLSKKKKLH